MCCSVLLQNNMKTFQVGFTCFKLITYCFTGRAQQVVVFTAIY